MLKISVDMITMISWKVFLCCVRCVLVPFWPWSSLLGCSLIQDPHLLLVAGASTRFKCWGALCFACLVGWTLHVPVKVHAEARKIHHFLLEPAPGTLWRQCWTWPRGRSRWLGDFGFIQNKDKRPWQVEENLDWLVGPTWKEVGFQGDASWNQSFNNVPCFQIVSWVVDNEHIRHHSLGGPVRWKGSGDSCHMYSKLNRLLHCFQTISNLRACHDISNFQKLTEFDRLLTLKMLVRLWRWQGVSQVLPWVFEIHRVFWHFHFPGFLNIGYKTRMPQLATILTPTWRRYFL